MKNKSLVSEIMRTKEAIDRCLRLSSGSWIGADSAHDRSKVKFFEDKLKELQTQLKGK